MNRRALLVLSAIGVVLGLFAASACVGDDAGAPALDADAGSIAGGDAGQNTIGGGDAGNGGGTCKGDTVEACGASCAPCTAPDGGTSACTSGACFKSCSGGMTACGDACIDTMTSTASCGRCDHDCGGGQCTAGVCQPFPVVTGLGTLHAIDISASGLVISAGSDVVLCAETNGCTATTLKTIGSGFGELGDVAVAGTDVYFARGQGDFGIVSRCPVAGCPPTGPIDVDTVVNRAVGRVVAGASYVAWSRDGSGGPMSQACALPGCTAVAVVRDEPAVSDPAREIVNPIQTMAAGPTKLFYATAVANDATKFLRGCPFGVACTTPIEIDTGSSSVSALTQRGGSIYGASRTAAGTDVIFGLSDAAPTAARTPLVGDSAGVNDVAVDDSGIYWVNGPTGKVERCASLTGCAGGGDVLATGQTATRIRLDGRFVYWMTPTAVMKLAK